MATEPLTVTQMLILVVAATVPFVYAFTHHGRARETILALWLPCWLFISRVVSPAIGRWPAGAPLELRLKIEAGYSLMDPLTLAWPLLVWSIFFWRRRAARKSGRKRVVNTTPSASPSRQMARGTSRIRLRWRRIRRPATRSHYPASS